MDETFHPAPGTTASGNRYVAILVVFSIALVLAIAALAYGMYRQDQRMQKMYDAMVKLSDKAPGTAPTDDATMEDDNATAPGAEPVVLEQETLDLVTGSFTLMHVCEGQVVYERTTDSGVPANLTSGFCIGNNLLLLKPSGMAAYTLVEQASTGVLDAPVLMSSSIVPSTGEAHELLVSFVPAPCIFDDNYCGAGVQFGQITHVVETIGSPSARQLNHYPATGILVWDGMGHAGLVEGVCGGAGCNAEPLSVYDLSADTLRQASIPVAVAPQLWADAPNFQEGQYPFNASSEKLPYWSDLVWNEFDGYFHVTLHNTDGTTTPMTFK